MRHREGLLPRRGRQHIDFKLTLCLSNPFQGTEAQKLAVWTQDLDEILAQSRNSDKWLRTPDGRLIFYLYNPAALPDAVQFPREINQCPDLVEKVAESYEALDRACGVDIAYVYMIHHQDHEATLGVNAQNDAYINAVLDYFPAVWGWIDPGPGRQRRGLGPAWPGCAGSGSAPTPRRCSGITPALNCTTRATAAGGSCTTCARSWPSPWTRCRASRCPPSSPT